MTLHWINPETGWANCANYSSPKLLRVIVRRYPLAWVTA
jgi:hypothetical protein